MVDNQIHQQFDAVLFQFGNQNLNVAHATISRIYLAVIGNVVAHVGFGALVAWRQPYCIDAELRKVVNFRDDARDITEAIGVGVFKTCWVDRVDGRVVPPMACRLRCTVWHVEDGMAEMKCGVCEKDTSWKDLHGSDIDIPEHSCFERRYGGRRDASFSLSPKDLASLVSYFEYMCLKKEGHG